MTLARMQEKNRPETPVEKIAASLKTDMAAVNSIILEKMHSDIPLIPELAGHLIAAGGKRIRPLLTLASARLFDESSDRQYRLAACVEFIHTATLLHDDVVYNSDLRRGKASANALFGNEAAVLVGDFLFSRSFQLMVEDGSIDVLRVLSNASAVIAEGEVLQLSTANNIETTEDQYFQVIRAKTAALFAAACEVGGIVAGRSAQECKALHDYGMNLGIAFQISDDVLDYAARQEKLGKELGDDFREGKMTLPVIYALKASNDLERAFWKRTLSDRDQQAGDFDRALKILQDKQALEMSLSLAKSYAGQGATALKALPHSALRDDLAQLIFFAADREF